MLDGGEGICVILCRERRCKMNKGKLKVTCIGLHESGKGIINIKGKDYLVSNLLEGETAIVEIIKTKHKTSVNVVKIEKNQSIG
ncbi:hypothetical protein ACI2OX_17315 [Bacillus sp. N9]